MKLLEGKVALITGGTRGIGRTLVEEFVNQGASVGFTFMGSAEKATEIEKNLAALGWCKAFQADAASTEAAQQVVDKIVEESGRLDIVVNNAGITRDNLILRMSEAQWDEVMNANLKSVFNYTKAATKTMMRQRHGVFINMTSVVGIGGNAGQTNYAASKGGIIAFTRSIAKELASRNIRANAIAPGFIATEMTAAIPETELQKWIAGIPLGRPGSTMDVAKLAVFLASDWASYITGQTIRVDGGME